MLPSVARTSVLLRTTWLVVLVLVIASGRQRHHAVASQLFATGATPGSFDAAIYLPSDEEVNAALDQSPAASYRAERQSTAPTGWDAGASYLIRPADVDPAGEAMRAHTYTFIISAAVLPSPDAASAVVNDIADRLLADHAPAREYPLSPQWPAASVREIRFEFIDPVSGEMRGSYSHLLRDGCAVVIIEAQGGVLPDFRGPAVDNDRGLILRAVVQLLARRLGEEPAPCSAS